MFNFLLAILRPGVGGKCSVLLADSIFTLHSHLKRVCNLIIYYLFIHYDMLPSGRFYCKESEDTEQFCPYVN